MEEAEGVLSFDFEGGLDALPVNPNPSMSLINLDSSSATVITGGSSLPGTASDPYAVNLAGRRSFRQTVCRHWLRGLCMKGEACGFLHQYDKSRMPICRFFRLFGECREQDCVYKHSNEDIKECNMYKLGFCPNGPDCRYRHAKLHGPPPTVEEAIQKMQSLVSFNYSANNRFLPNRNSGFIQPSEKSQFPLRVIGGTDQNLIPNLSTIELNNEQQQEAQHALQQIDKTQTQIISNGQLQESRMSFPLPQGVSRYFIVKSCNRENLELSVQQGVWATQRSNEAKLNEAFDCVDNVILIFSINRTRHFQGCAKMTSKIGGYVGGGNWKYAHGTAHYGRNFRVKWCKLCELSFIKTRHLRNPYNENLPVKISRDCQEIEPSIGEQLAALLYLEPDSDLMGIARAAETKREEEREKGGDESNGREDPDIVPFEDNEEEEDEESEEEEEAAAAGILMGAGILGRGRGGLLWPMHMALPPGARPLPGIPGYPYDPFSLLSDQYGAAATRHFSPFAPPRLPGGVPDLASAAGVMFQGRPSQAAAAVFPPAGLGMMMGPMRPAPFMGPMAMPAPARVGLQQPVFPPLHFPPPGGGWGGRREQNLGRNSGGGGGPDGGGEQEGGEVEEFARPEESESEEDEAPRRSRHAEGKRKR